MNSPVLILYLEDNPRDAELALDKLQQLAMPHELLIASDRAQYETALAESRFDLIISDYALPDYNGFAALALALEKQPDVPFILISGTLSEEQAVECLRRGATDYVIKQNLKRLAPAVLRALTEAEVQHKRWQAEAALQASEQQLQVYVDNAGDAIYVVERATGRIQNCNVRACHDLGYSRAELLQLSTTDIEAQLSSKAVVEIHQQQEAGEPRTVTGTHRRKDGTLFPVEIRLNSLAPAQPELIISIVRDITERQRGEQALRESEKRFMDVLYAARDAILLIEGEQFVDCNEATAQMLGYASRDAFLLRHPSQLSPPLQPDGRQSFEKAHEMMQTAIANGSHRFEWVHRRANGEDFPVEVSLTAISYGGKTVLHCLWRDITERKRAAETARASEAKYRALIETTKTGYLILDLEGKVVDANPEYVRLTGHRDLHEILGRSVIEWTAEYEKERNAQAVAQCTRDGFIRGFEVDYLDSTGRITPVEINATVVRDGETVRILSLCRDITERRRVEAALQESVQMIEGIIDTMPVRVFWKDKNLAYLGCNAAFARDAGFAVPNDLIGKDDFQLVWREQAEAYCADDRAVIESGRAKLLIEESQTTPAGDTITLLTSKLPLRNAHGEITGVLGMYMDITERKRAETEIRNEQALSHAIIEGIPGTFYMLDENGKYVRWSAYQRDAIVGKSDAEVAQTLALDTIHPDDRALILSKIENVLTNDMQEAVEGRVLLRGGPAFVWLLMTGRRIVLNGRPFLVGIGIDITERKRAETEKGKLEDQLRQAQKMESVGRLAGGVAHDFNNLLMGIMNYTQLCRDKIAPDHPIQEYLAEITHDSERSAEITRQLLAFARKQTIAPKVLDLNDAVAGMLKLLQRLIGEDIKLAWRPGVGLRPVKLDPSQVDQILANLCVNARDAIAGVGEVTLETGSIVVDAEYCARHKEAIPGWYVFLAVSDDGCGMDKETLAQVFEPFFTTKGLGKGTGLGLATVYGIVKQNNGLIDATSEPGKGTTFKIYLPAIAAEAEAPVTSKAQAPRGRGETVLLVEDEKSLRVTCGAFLDALGYKVMVAETPGEALKMVAGHPGDIHVLLTDVVMPGMDGRQLAKRLDAVKPGVKTLFMSGYTADVIAQRGVLDEGVQFLSKPFTRDDLARKVREMLEGPRPD